jgi:hypothetical protein
MIGIEKPFSIGQGGELVINHDVIRGIEPFASIIKRHSPSKGDSDGRKKIVNFNEIKFIYFMADWDTYHRGLPAREKEKKAKEDAGFASTWKPDELVLQGIKKYTEIVDEYIPSARILISLEKGLSMSAVAVQSYIAQMEKIVEMNSVQLDALEDLADEEASASIMAANKIIQENIGEILKIGRELPKTLDGIIALQEKVRKEAGTAKKLQGDRTKRNREDPK